MARIWTMFGVPQSSYGAAKKEIASRIKEARVQSGLSQRDVAQALSTSQSSYSRIERGVLSPDCGQIRVLSGLYGVSILWLMGMPSYFVYADKPLPQNNN
jgi:transcriptional regulator with XRE-family HTH domain